MTTRDEDAKPDPSRRRFLGQSSALVAAVLTPAAMQPAVGAQRGQKQLPRAAASDFLLNGLGIEVDERNGCITRLVHEDVGIILQSPAELAGILTVGYPVKDFVGLQLEPRLSHAEITRTPGELVLTWAELRSNRDQVPRPSGKVSGSVRLRAAPDGRSVILSATVSNHSRGVSGQILFPDLRGLRPFDEPERMELRMAMGVVNPFAGNAAEQGRSPFYPSALWQQYPAGGFYHRNALKWMDFGSLAGGISLFERTWMTEPRPGILTHRSEADPDDLRVAWQHKVTLQPGETWESEEYWLTPHRGGWAKGIEVFRQYLGQANPPRDTPVPARIRDGVGFQTIWMIQSSEPDPAHAAFRFADIPRIARDAKEHGIDELVLWGWCTYGSMPIQHRAELGTAQDLVDAVRGAKALGVNVVPFVSIKQVDDVFAERYGVKPGSSASWTYHPELIPAMFPFEAPSGRIDVETSNAVWQKDVADALTAWGDKGITSFAWDVFDDAGKMSLIDLIRRVRRQLARPGEAPSFAGEPADGSAERAGQVLDYTWNWFDYVEAGPWLNAVRYPRLNVNIERSARVVKLCFADGLYINASPKRPNQPNGTRLIGEEPELAAALKQVAPLRARFLKYFVDGYHLGDSVLSRPVCRFVRKQKASMIGGATTVMGELEFAPIHVCGHQLADRLLIVVLNNEDQPRRVELASDLRLWLPEAQAYRVRYCDEQGQTSPQVGWSGRGDWVGTTRRLRPLELAFFEISVA